MSVSYGEEAVSTRPGRRRGELTAERILRAAEALFAEHGYAGTTLRDIAEAVGLRNPSLYNHFPSKESLYAAVLERGISPVLEALSAYADSEAPARQDSRDIIEQMIALLAERPHLPRLIQHEILSGGEHLNPMLREWIRPIFEEAQNAIKASPAASRWASEKVPLVMLAMFHTVAGYFTIAPVYKDLNGQDLLTDEALARQASFCSELVGALFTDTNTTREH